MIRVIQAIPVKLVEITTDMEVFLEKMAETARISMVGIMGMAQTPGKMGEAARFLMAETMATGQSQELDMEAEEEDGVGDESGRGPRQFQHRVQVSLIPVLSLFSRLNLLNLACSTRGLTWALWHMVHFCVKPLETRACVKSKQISLVKWI